MTGFGRVTLDVVEGSGQTGLGPFLRLDVRVGEVGESEGRSPGFRAGGDRGGVRGQVAAGQGHRTGEAGGKGLASS